MSRARHGMKKANGGEVKPVWEAGGETNAAKEAEEKRHGGAVKGMHGEGEKSKHRADRPKRARGGAVHGRSMGGRLRGEGAGADRMPLTTASKVKLVTKGETPVSGDDKVM